MATATTTSTQTSTSPQQSAKPRVLVPEKLSPDGLSLLRSTLDVDERKGLSPEQLSEIVGDYESLVVRSETKVTAELLSAAKKLKVVARAGVGTDNIDVAAATKLGVVVVNSPSGNIGAAAEHTIALLLSLARNVPDGCSSLKASKWERSRLVGVEVKSKTLGIIGLGKVGLTVARFANGLNMRVVAMDPYASPAIAQAANVTLVSSLPELLTTSDFLTIHTPLMATTKGMISTDELAQMKKGARLLNVARGGVIDEAALLTSIESGHIGGAAIDVWTSEPPTADSPAAALIAHPKVVATPHLGASTVEAQENVSIDVCEQVLSILAGDLPRSAVNAPLILPEEYRTLQPFVHLVEKMGALYTQYYTAPHRSGGSGGGKEAAATTFDLIYEGTLAEISNTKPLYAALIKGFMSSISDNNVNIVNYELVAKSRGLVVNEQKSRSPPEHSFSSLVTLRARPSVPSREPSPFSQRSAAAASATSAAGGAPVSPGPGLGVKSGDQAQDRSICGYVSGSQAFISRLDRFATSFAPEGNMLICHNYDAPGAIGRVGGSLGSEGVNINFMTVAPLTSVVENGTGGAPAPSNDDSKEALMILGVDQEVKPEVITKIGSEQGILSVSQIKF